MPAKRRSRRSSGDADASRFVFDEAAADNAVRFIESLELREAGKPFVLLPWQREIVRELFGWKERVTGRRRYRRLSCWLPRGNGKTPFAAALALCVLFLSGIQDAEIYSVAADTKQAEISFLDGAHMVRSSATLASLTKPYRRSLVYDRNRSSWVVMSSESKTKHGYRPYCVIFDELHAQSGRDLWAAMKTGLGKGDRDTLLISISTAGVYDPESVGFCEYSYARKVKDGVVEDPHLLPVIFEADPAVQHDGRWSDPEVWAACNPGLGVTIQREVLEDEARQAKEDPAALAEFLQLRLNIWVQATMAAIHPEQWAVCDARPLLVEGSRPLAYGGMDVGEKDDLTAIGLWVPHADGTASVIVEGFMPESKALALGHKHQVPYVAWMRDGFIRPSGLNYVDPMDMRARWRELRESYDIVEIAFDPWNAYRMAAELAEEDDFTTVEIPQTMKHLSEATKEFISLVVDGKIRAGGNPFLRWMVSNLVLFRDGKGNVVPQKQAKNQKIDGVVALINAFARARLSDGPSVYETRGLLTI